MELLKIKLKFLKKNIKTKLNKVYMILAFCSFNVLMLINYTHLKLVQWLALDLGVCSSQDLRSVK